MRWFAISGYDTDARVIESRERAMTTVISFINLKGGVGKTTVAVNTAAQLAREHRKKVLLVDLDPQTNATVSVIDQPTWRERHDAGQTLFHLFDDMLNSKSRFDIGTAVMSNVGKVKGLDLLPSSLELVEIQDAIPDMDNKAFVSHVDVLGNAIDPIRSSYDYVVIDCPPNLGAITLNGISISDFYVVPTVPDILSKIGISLITNRIESFKKKKRSCQIELAGIIFTKIDRRTNLHNSTMKELRSEYPDDVFKAELPQRISIAEAPVDSRPFATSTTARGKSDFDETLALFSGIAVELIERTQ